MSLITIIQGAARRVNYPPQPVAIGTLDPNIALLVDCAQDAGDDAVERVNWQSLKLQTPAQFIGDGVTAAFPLPAGFQAFAPSDVFVSNLYPTWKLPGPVAEGDLLRLKALPMAIPVHVWRQVGGVPSNFGSITQAVASSSFSLGGSPIINMLLANNFGVLPNAQVFDQTIGGLLIGVVSTWSGNTLILTTPPLLNSNASADQLTFVNPPSGITSALIVPQVEFFPVLGVGEVVTFVYAQGNWITNAAGQQYSSPIWQADSDLSLIPERLIRLGAIWRWKRRKSLDYSEEMNDYEGALDRLGGLEDTLAPIGMSDDIGAYDTWPGIITDNSDHTY